MSSSWAHPLCDIIFYDMIDGSGDDSFDFKQSFDTARHQVTAVGSLGFETYCHEHVGL